MCPREVAMAAAVGIVITDCFRGRLVRAETIAAESAPTVLPTAGEEMTSGNWGIMQLSIHPFQSLCRAAINLYK